MNINTFKVVSDGKLHTQNIVTLTDHFSVISEQKLLNKKLELRKKWNMKLEVETNERYLILSTNLESFPLTIVSLLRPLPESRTIVI